MESQEEPMPMAGASRPGGEMAERARQLEAMNPTPLAGKPRDSKRKNLKEEELRRFTAVHTKPAGITEKKGTTGDPVRLFANYIDVTLTSKEQVCQYQFDITPKPATRGKCFGILRKFGLANELAKDQYVYDGGAVVYTARSASTVLGQEKVDTMEFDGGQIQVRFRRTNVMDADNPQFLVLMNTQLNRFLESELKLIRVNNDFYDANAKLEPEGYQQRLEIWPGYETSINVYEGNNLLLNLDQRFRIVRKENAMSALREAFMKAKSNNTPTEQCQAIAGKAVIGSTVETSYNHQVYRVQAVEWTKTPMQTFENRRRGENGKFESVQTTLTEYFLTRYNQKVTDQNQPLLVVKPSNKALRRKGTDQILLIPEFCRLTGYTDAIRQDFRLMQAISKHTKLDPTRRKQETDRFIHKLTTNENIKRDLQKWDTNYGSEMKKLMGRALRPQELFQRDKRYSYDAQTADWTSGMRGALFDTPIECNIWLVLCTERDKAATDAFCRQILEVSPPMGMRFGQPKIVPLGSDRPEAYLDTIQKMVRSDLALVMAVFPSNSKDRYDALKLQLCCNLPCPSQCMVAKTINGAPGKLKSVATKVVCQINAKLGGDIWRMHFPFQEPTMIMGIDTQRDRSTKKSVIAAASTWNRNFTMYHNAAVFANDDDDVMANVVNVIRACVDDFKTRNNIYPKAVYVYRDGITDGQIEKVKTMELAKVKDYLGSVSGQGKINLTYVLVNKRENTRFFQAMPNGIINPLSGTVVDDVVTRPSRFDFYLVSQSVREGTVAPTYYNVIEHQNSTMKPEFLQQMTYMLCHMYYNWPGTIRVPAPCQYAKKHSEMVATNLHKLADPQLRHKQFYL